MSLKTNILIAISFIITINKGITQGTYYGHKNDISLIWNFSPSILPKHDLKKKNSISKVSNRYAYSNFKISYGYLIHSKLHISAQYFFKRMALQTANFYYYNSAGGQILKDPRLNLHGFSISGKYFRKGSSAPIGKYIGLTAKCGFVKMRADERFYVGTRDLAVADNFHRTNYDVYDIDFVTPPSDSTYRFFQMDLLVGRTYPLTKRLMISIGTRIPFISTLFKYPRSDFSFSFSSGKVNYTVPVINIKDPSGLQRLPWNTLKKLNRISFDLALRYYF